MAASACTSSSTRICFSGRPRWIRMVGSMKMMPFDDHRKQNDTIQSRMVRLRRSGVSSCATVTPASATSGGRMVGGHRRQRLAFGGLLLDLGDGALGLRDAASAEEIADQLRHEDAHEEQQHRRHHAGDEDRAPALGRHESQADERRERQARPGTTPSSSRPCGRGCGPGCIRRSSVSATGTSPPRPKFDRKRNTASDSTFHDAPTRPVNSEKMPMVAANEVRRPM